MGGFRSFEQSARQGGPSVSPARLRREGIDLLLGNLPPARSVLELGTGSPRVAELVAAKLSTGASYRRISFGEEAVPGETLPVADGAHDLFLCCYLLENLRSDQLYMVLSEARRVLAPGGHWLLLSRAPGFLQMILPWVLPESAKGIELSHFLSPEDWEVESDHRVSSEGVTSRLMVLRKIPG